MVCKKSVQIEQKPLKSGVLQFSFYFFYKNPTNQPNPERFIAQFISLKLQNSRFLLHYQLSYEIEL